MKSHMFVITISAIRHTFLGIYERKLPMTNWDIILNQKNGQKSLVAFAMRGSNVSATSFKRAFVGTQASGTVRSLISTHGSLYARRLARKALRRRAIIM